MSIYYPCCWLSIKKHSCFHIFSILFQGFILSAFHPRDSDCPQGRSSSVKPAQLCGSLGQRWNDLQRGPKGPWGKEILETLAIQFTIQREYKGYEDVWTDKEQTLLLEITIDVSGKQRIKMYDCSICEVDWSQNPAQCCHGHDHFNLALPPVLVIQPLQHYIRNWLHPNHPSKRIGKLRVGLSRLGAYLMYL